jgi:hypothetical protein
MSCFGKYGGLMVAMLMCQVGMILFNLGLTYGFAGGRSMCSLLPQCVSHCA